MFAFLVLLHEWMQKWKYGGFMALYFREQALAGWQMKENYQGRTRNSQQKAKSHCSTAAFHFLAEPPCTDAGLSTRHESGTPFCLARTRIWVCFQAETVFEPAVEETSILASIFSPMLFSLFASYDLFNPQTPSLLMLRLSFSKHKSHSCLFLFLYFSLFFLFIQKLHSLFQGLPVLITRLQAWEMMAVGTCFQHWSGFLEGVLLGVAIWMCWEMSCDTWAVSELITACAHKMEKCVLVGHTGVLFYFIFPLTRKKKMPSWNKLVVQMVSELKSQLPDKYICTFIYECIFECKTRFRFLMCFPTLPLI